MVEVGEFFILHWTLDLENIKALCNTLAYLGFVSLWDTNTLPF